MTITQEINVTEDSGISPVLEFTNLSKTFGPTKALSGVDFDVFNA